MKHLYFLLGLLLTGAGAAAQSEGSNKPCPYDSAHFDLFHPVPRSRLRPLRPDRPGVSESPFTVDAGHLQVETDGFRLINARAGDERSREWKAAYSTVKLGLSRRTDIQAEIPLYKVQKDRQVNDPDWQRHAGFGDLAVRVKHNFLGDDQEGPVAMSVVGYARLPTGGQAGNGGAEYGLIVPVDVELPEHFNLEVQLESDLNYDRDLGRRYLCLMPSVAIDHEFNDHFSFLVEGVSRWDAEHAGWRSSLNLAPIFTITNNLQFDLGTHLALNRETDREFFFGFTFRR